MSQAQTPPRTGGSDRTTTREVADRLGLSPETVLRRWRAGELPGYRLSSNVLRFDEDELEAWLRARRRGSDNPGTKEEDRMDDQQVQALFDEALARGYRLLARPNLTPSPDRPECAYEALIECLPMAPVRGNAFRCYGLTKLKAAEGAVNRLRGVLERGDAWPDST